MWPQWSGKIRTIYFDMGSAVTRVIASLGLVTFEYEE